MRLGSLFPALVALLCLTACQEPAAPAGRGETGAMAGAAPSALPPLSKKEVLKLLFANADVKLSVDASCAGVGSDFSDATIGDYVSGLLAQQAQPGGKNWIEVACEPQPETSAGRFWKCSVVFHRVDGEERGGWGVAFLVRASTRTAVRESFRCTGAG